MIRFASRMSFLLLVGTTASATPAIPSFEFSAAQLQASITAMRLAQVKTKSGDIGSKLTSLTWDLQRSERDVSQLRRDLNPLMGRVRRHETPAP